MASSSEAPKPSGKNEAIYFIRRHVRWCSATSKCDMDATSDMKALRRVCLMTRIVHSFFDSQGALMCPESTTNSRSSGFFEEGAGMTHASVGELDVVLSEFLCLNIFLARPMLLCGRIVLVSRFPEVPFPQILPHTDCVLEVHTFAYPARPAELSPSLFFLKNDN